MASYLDKGTVKFIILAGLFAFLLQARPPQQEVDIFERPVGWIPGASRPSNRSNQEAVQFHTSYGITCGEPKGTTYVSNGREYVSDLGYLSPGTENNIGDFSYTEGYEIQNASDQGLYVRERFGPMTYTFPNLENGVYDVIFYETEAWYKAPGQRVFAVYIDEVLTSESSVDLFLRAGGSRIATDFTIQHAVTTNQMVISFQPLVDQPKINAIWLQKVGELPQNPTPVPADSTPAPETPIQAPETSTEVPTQAPDTPESTPAPEDSTPAPEDSTPAPELSTPAPEASTPEPELPTPAPETSTSAPEDSTPAPELPTEDSTPVPTEDSTPAPELPTPAPELSTPEPELPTPAPETSTPAPENSTPAPETSKAAQTGGEESAVEQSPTVPPAPMFKPVPEETQSVPEWILKGLPISFFSTLACMAVAGPIAELFGYKTVIAIGVVARVLIQLVLLFGLPLAVAQVQYGIGAAADVILVAFLFLHVAERHFQLATSIVVAAGAIGFVGAAGTRQVMQYFAPDVVIQWLPLGSMLLAAVLAALLPQDPVRDELERTKGDRQGAGRLPLRRVFGPEGLVSEFSVVYKSKALWILSFWWVFASAVNSSLLNYAPDLLTEFNPGASFNQYAIHLVHILSAVGALTAIKLAAPVARTGGLAYLLGSLTIGLAAVGALLVPNLGMAYTSLVVTSGIAQMLLCLVFAQSAALVSNGRFALLFGTNATLALLVQGGAQLALNRMGWHIGDHFFVLGLASICGSLLFGLLWAIHKCATGRTQLVNPDDLAGDYNLIGGSRHGSSQALPIYEIQDESAWKVDDVDENDEGDVEMLGLIEGRPESGVVVKNEGPLTRL